MASCPRRLALRQLPEADAQLVDRFPKPQPDGATQLRLTSLELIGRLATLISSPRIHRHRYYGVLAPNSPQRTQVTALARQLSSPRHCRCLLAIPRRTPSARRRAIGGPCCSRASHELLP